MRELRPRYGAIPIFKAPEVDVITPEKIRSQDSGPFGGRRTSVFQPNHVKGRIVVQSGWFKVHKYLSSKAGFVALEKNKLYKSKLVKLIVPPESFSDLRYQLDRLGINRGSVFPELDGLCAQIQWQHTLLSDEVEEDKPSGSRAKTSPTKPKERRAVKPHP